MDRCNLSSNIHHEVAKGNVASIYAFIQEGKDLNFRDLDDNTPLHIAAAKGYEDIVDMLLDYGVDIEASNSFGWTPLMQAARSGYNKVVEILIKHGADSNATNKYGLTALALASASGNVEIVQYLLSGTYGENNTNELQMPDISPLSIAALYGNYNIVRYLLARGADANTLSPKRGITPLLCAAAAGDLASVDLLLKQGANPGLRNWGNYSALEVASVHSNNEIIDLLRSYEPSNKNDRRSDIFEVIRRGDLIKVEEILAIDPYNAQMVTEEGMTGLMMASVLNQLPVARLLLQYNADVNAQDYIKGWTPIMQAIYHRHLEMTVLLYESGADLNIRCFKEYSAFDIAKEVKISEILQLLSNDQENSSIPERKSSQPRSSDFLRQQSVKFKGFFTKIFKRESGTSPVDPAYKTYRRNSLPQSLLHNESHSGTANKYPPRFVFENGSTTFMKNNNPQCDVNYVFREGYEANACDLQFNSFLVNRKRHSEPNLKLFRTFNDSKLQNGQRNLKVITNDSVSSPKTFIKMSEYDDIAVIRKKIGCNSKGDKAIPASATGNECSYVKERPSEYDGSLIKERQRPKSLHQNNNVVQSSPSLEKDAQFSEFDSIESILERIELQRRDRGYKDGDDLDEDPYITMQRKGYKVLEGAAEDLQKWAKEVKVRVYRC